jgi:hypothetical protein
LSAALIQLRRLVRNAESCRHLAHGAIASADQLNGLASELLEINRWTTHCGLLPLGSLPE